MSIHIEAKKEDISNFVIMPGDPKRAQYIAKKYLEKYKTINTVRNMLGYTGFYKGKKVTVIGSGMGISSMSIYAYELFKEYDVDKIIRVGSAGSYSEKLNLRDIILVNESYTNSNFSYNFNGKKVDNAIGSRELNDIILNKAIENKIPIIPGNVLTSETFYSNTSKHKTYITKYNCIAVEMETFVLFYTAKYFKKQASAILSISDSIFTEQKLTPYEREQTLDDMIFLALESCL